MQIQESKKKKKQNFQINFKTIQNDFINEYEKHELWLLYEYCEYDQFLTQKVLETQKRYFLRSALKTYLKNPKEGNSILKNIIEETNQLLKQKKQLQEVDGLEEEKKFWFDDQTKQYKPEQQNQFKLYQQVEQQDVKQKNMKPGIITKINQYIILHILEFLNPLEITNFSLTAKMYLQFGKKPQIYKKYCLVLYPNTSQLPDTSPFESLRDYIIQHPSEFHPHLIQMAQTNIRQLVWGQQIEQYKQTPSSYFKQFLNWPNMYVNAPRLHFCGVYRIQEKYIKIGERDIGHQYAPLIEIKYNRYFRFFPDGRFRYAVTVSKLNEQQIIRLMKDSGQHEFEIEGRKEQQKVIEGEYLKQKDFVIAKYPQGSSVFEFQMQIRSSEDRLHNLLLVLSQDMHSIDVLHTYTTNIYKCKEEVNMKTFSYKHIYQLRSDLGNEQIALMTH